MSSFPTPQGRTQVLNETVGYIVTAFATWAREDRKAARGICAGEEVTSTRKVTLTVHPPRVYLQVHHTSPVITPPPYPVKIMQVTATFSFLYTFNTIIYFFPTNRGETNLFVYKSMKGRPTDGHQMV